MSSRSGGQDQGAEDVAGLDHLLGLLAARDVDALDPLAELVAGEAAVDPAVVGAELEVLELVLGNLVEEGDPRLALVAGEREADQHAERDRVDDEQRDDQRRAAQDLQVLEQQPAHRRPAQCPRSRRKATNAASKSPPEAGGAAAWSAAAVPSNTVSPSARTSRRLP